MKILVPFDGSLPAGRALRFAIGLTRVQKGSRIVVVNVQNIATLGAVDAMIDWAQEQAYAAEQSEKILRKALALCRKAKVKADSRAEVGPIAPTIHRLARKLSVDQIVMGSRGLGGIRGLFLGSVATQLVHLTDVPVTLVK
jgi:nucleotide-binding universal stress UspA family protein